MLSLNRDHFYLKEVADKLEITEFDLQDYISRGLLRAYVYLTANDIESRNSELYYLDGTRFRDERYVYLHPDSYREIFASGFINEWRFYISMDDYLTVPGRKPKILVREKSLMISASDLKCFIGLYEVNSEKKKTSNRGGRPSAMLEVLAEYERRVKNRETYKHKTHEALALHNWARLNIKDKAVPGVNTIRGWLSEPKDKSANAA
jgi:hypothetical protein